MTLKLTTVLFAMSLAGALGALNFYPTASAEAESLNDRIFIRQLGGYRSANVDAADVVRIAGFAAYTISASSNSGPVKLIRIVKAWKQVVAGTNYKLILELFNKYTGKVMRCQVIVFDQPWTNTLELTSSSCSSKRERRQVPGGYMPRNVNDPDVKEMAKFASTIITANTHPHLALIKILKAESQVVAGTNYRMTLLFASGPHSRYLLLCGVIVFDQSWTNTRKLTESKCRWIRRSSADDVEKH